MASGSLRILVADDERPARAFLIGILKEVPDVAVVGEAATGEEALVLIEAQRPDLVLLDLQMPVMGGLDVVRHIRPDRMPLVAFVTAFDDYALHAFELNAIDYLLKPVEKERLLATLDRARGRLQAGESSQQRAMELQQVVAAVDQMPRRAYLERIPVRRRNDVVLLPVRQIASVVAEKELLHVTTLSRERFTITHRLHLLEERLDPRRFVRLARGTLASIDAIVTISPMPGGTYLATLSNGQELQVSRTQSRILRETLLKI